MTRPSASGIEQTAKAARAAGRTRSARSAEAAGHSWRDQIAFQVMSICMAETARQIATGSIQRTDADNAVSFIAALSYAMADAMLIARNGQ